MDIDIEGIVAQIDLEKLKAVGFPPGSDSFPIDEKGEGFTIFLYRKRLADNPVTEDDYVGEIKNGAEPYDEIPETPAADPDKHFENAVVIMRYAGRGEFDLIGEWSMMDIDTFGLPTPEDKTGEGKEYLRIGYDGLHCDDIGLNIPIDIPIETMKEEDLQKAMVAQAVVAWTMASNYIREHGRFIPLEEHVYGEMELTRRPSWLLDFNVRDEKRVKIQIVDYLIDRL